MGKNRKRFAVLHGKTFDVFVEHGEKRSGAKMLIFKAEPEKDWILKIFSNFSDFIPCDEKLGIGDQQSGRFVERFFLLHTHFVSKLSCPIFLRHKLIRT